MDGDARIQCVVQGAAEWGAARALELRTRRSVIHTPIFMPVATVAALRGVDLSVAAGLDYQVLLANTYHLLIRPGMEVLRGVGGIHPFMGWKGGVLTDSGGYQIFSLSAQTSLTEDGAIFRSYHDGRTIALTPELSIEAQGIIGSDIMMVLDHCISSRASEEQTRAALELTTRWAQRSFAARSPDSTQALFGIVQGGCFPELRRESAGQITAIPFDGYAIGGLAVGESKGEREDTTEFAAALLPFEKPRYLMGVGTPIDLLEAVRRGVDMFDCILPTALAVQGVCFTSRGRIDLRRGVYRLAQEPLDPNCGCTTCSRFTRAYLHHLVRVREPVSAQLLSVHNLFFYRTLMERMRAAILARSFQRLYQNEAAILAADDCDNPPRAPVVRARQQPRVARGAYRVVVRPGVAGGEPFGVVQHAASGETMHSQSDPYAEAYGLYVAQPGLVERVGAPSDTPLVVWDVGMGAAMNVMACIRKLEAIERFQRPVEIVSFEHDLDPLRLATDNPTLFAHVRHRAPHALLRAGEWRSGVAPVVWRLQLGDLRECAAQAAPPDIIWYDPFSYKVEPSMWTVSTFERLLSATRGHAASLYTYSASTAVRVSMLVAGWFVGYGVATGTKRETTVAFTPAAAAAGQARQLLDGAWLQRWERSQAAAPMVEAGGAPPTVQVLHHPQFQAGPGVG